MQRHELSSRVSFFYLVFLFLFAFNIIHTQRAHNIHLFSSTSLSLSLSLPLSLSLWVFIFLVIIFLVFWSCLYAYGWIFLVNIRNSKAYVMKAWRTKVLWGGSALAASYINKYNIVSWVEAKQTRNHQENYWEINIRLYISCS